MVTQRLAVRNRIDTSFEENLKTALSREGQVKSLRLSRVFWILDSSGKVLNSPQAEQNLRRVFADPLSEEILFGFPEFEDDKIYAEVRFHGGVTDNWARSSQEALNLVFSETAHFEVHSGWFLEIKGDLGQEVLEKALLQTLANTLLQKIEIYQGSALKVRNSFASFESYWHQTAESKPELQLFDLSFDKLKILSEQRCLALSDSEIETIIRHFSSPEEKQKRKAWGWEGRITEVELECLAQTWSEHCKHKIFAAEVEYSEQPGSFPALGTKSIVSLYKSYIQAATKKLEDCNYLVSVFKDNAGIVDFDDKINVCVKVETHNSPSALDPFGGALTGILGVNRDILGCGLGAKPIANMDVFCLSQKNLFPDSDSPQRPELLKDPGVIFRGVHQGVEEGGNQSGIPTVNGSFCFASEFAAKPLIFVGSVGVMPKTVNGRRTEEKSIRPGDLIVVAGGRLGKDGVHGATFSSLELNNKISSNVVQIGDSITQKRLLDFTLQARDLGLIQALTDNGAGGLSSSIGEMAQLSNGARLDLSKHLVKYPGLEYWEMLVSESQERMSYAVAPENLQKFLDLARRFAVEASCLGEFTNSGIFEVNYGETALARLNLQFLHEGLSRMKLKAHFAGSKVYNEFHRSSAKKSMTVNSKNIGEVLKVLLSSPNVASREPLVRYYDHEVQAATRLKPYGGTTQQGANDAAVIDLSLHGGSLHNGLAVANGLCPQLSYYDTYLMAQRAVDEAVRNLVATGASPSKMALVDNFCWPDPTPKSSNPDAEHKMAQLVRACAGLYEAALAYRAPLVSGKDSMKNDFIGKNQTGEVIKISVPPTLLVTAIAQVPDARKTIPGYFQNAGDKIYILGQETKSLYGSVYSHEYSEQSDSGANINAGFDVGAPEYPDLQKNFALYELIHKAIQKDLLLSCHDVSDGGMLTALVESCFGNSLGAQVNLSPFEWEHLWSELGSQFIVSVSPSSESQFRNHFQGWCRELGEVKDQQQLEWTFQNESNKEDLKVLHNLWSQGVLNVYHA